MRKKMPVNAKAPAMRKHDWGNEAAILSRRDIKGCSLWEPVKPVLLFMISYEVFCYIIVDVIILFKHSGQALHENMRLWNVLI